MEYGRITQFILDGGWLSLSSWIFQKVFKILLHLLPLEIDFISLCQFVFEWEQFEKPVINTSIFNAWSIWSFCVKPQKHQSLTTHSYQNRLTFKKHEVSMERLSISFIWYLGIDNLGQSSLVKIMAHLRLVWKLSDTSNSDSLAAALCSSIVSLFFCVWLT